MWFRLLFAGMLWVSFYPISAQNLPRFALVVHGAAGVLGEVSSANEARYRVGLERALQAGYALLKEGGTAVDAVEASIRTLEDDSLFNEEARGLYLRNGHRESDASMMEGKELRAGAIAGLTPVRNPIEAARTVMEQSPPVMVFGQDADAFAASHGCLTRMPFYGHTRLSRKHPFPSHKPPNRSLNGERNSRDWNTPVAPKYRTVGAVALDAFGNLAAGTSTEYLHNKHWSPQGERPLIGAITYASNSGCAVSCAGPSGYFVRLALAKSLSDELEIHHKPLQDAADEMIFEKLATMGAAGGLIAIDRKGNIAMPFNTDGMFRGYVREDGSICTEIFAQ